MTTMIAFGIFALVVLAMLFAVALGAAAKRPEAHELDGFPGDES